MSNGKPIYNLSPPNRDAASVQSGPPTPADASAANAAATPVVQRVPPPVNLGQGLLFASTRKQDIARVPALDLAAILSGSTDLQIIVNKLKIGAPLTVDDYELAAKAGFF